MWSTAISDLRTLLNDNPTDRYYYRKRCFGQVDGVNTSFKTFEFRRVTDFSNSATAAPLGVYLNGVLQPSSNFSSDNILTGEFNFVTAPPAATNGYGTVVEATYYSQQWLDSELDSMLVQTCNELQFGSTYANLNPILWKAALYLSAADAMKKISMRWAMRASDTFLVDDAPKKEALGVADTYTKLSSTFLKDGMAYRDSAYKDRAGQALAPNFQSAWGRVGAVTPRR